MPLIVIAGKPCTGKTTFANLLVAALRERGSAVQLVNEETLQITKAAGYATSTSEKATRGAIKSRTDHHLTAETYVVVDSLNYIKGFRYELHCSARTFRTPQCVVWVACADTTADVWNETRVKEGGDGYEAKIMDDLRMRFEAPNEANRWDSPLFRVCLSADVTSADVTTGAGDAVIADAGAVAGVASALQGISLTGEAGSSSSSSSSTGEANCESASATLSVPVKSPFSSWKPKKKTTIEAGTGAGTGNGAAGPGGDDATVFSSFTTASAQTQKSISFSGSMVSQEVSSNTLKGFMVPALVLERVFEYFGKASAPAPNASTVAVHKADPDFLYELDRVSQEVLVLVVAHMQADMQGPLMLTQYARSLTFTRHAGVAELQRYRRQYVKINGQHPPTTSAAIGASFVDFLAIHI